MTATRSTILFAAALAATTGAVALDHAAHGVPEPVPAATAQPAAAAAPCSAGAPALAPCAAAAPAPRTLQPPPPPPAVPAPTANRAAPPPPPAALPEGADEAPDLAQPEVGGAS
ncbi:MAG: hypothetical protein AAF739_08195 [Pseudomonadota bacterium]